MIGVVIGSVFSAAYGYVITSRNYALERIARRRRTPGWWVVAKTDWSVYIWIGPFFAQSLAEAHLEYWGPTGATVIDALESDIRKITGENLLVKLDPDKAMDIVRDRC